MFLTYKNTSNFKNAFAPLIHSSRIFLDYNEPPCFWKHIFTVDPLKSYLLDLN